METSVLKVRVTPGAKVSVWAGVMPDGRRRVKVAAPPIEGRANEVLVRFVAESLGLRFAGVRLTRGLGGRNKALEVDLDEAELAKRLSALGDGDERKSG